MKRAWRGERECCLRGIQAAMWTIGSSRGDSPLYAVNKSIKIVKNIENNDNREESDYT
jgi:hypothetical protein